MTQDEISATSSSNKI